MLAWFFVLQQPGYSASSRHFQKEKMSSWRNDIQSLVKKCRILALCFYPKYRIGVECLTRGGTEFTLTAALVCNTTQQCCAYLVHYIGLTRWMIGKHSQLHSQHDQKQITEYIFCWLIDHRFLVLFQPIGREMVIHLLDYFTTQYSINTSIQKLLRNTRIHLMPSMNPDGFEKAQVGDCLGVRGR
jgi:hypothetical protein